MKSRIIGIVAALGAAVLVSCVKIDGRMGSGLVDSSLQYDTYTAEFTLDNLQMKMADNLSGYSDTRITIGAIRDDVFGLTTRASAFTLIPAYDTLDLGKNPVPVKFDIHFARDSVSCADASQQHILQNVNVYSLTQALSSSSLESGTNQDIPHGTTRISRGVPIYNGADSLSFEFTRDFAQEYLDKIAALENSEHVISSYEDYVAALPGIYIDMDAPEGNGGRINMFELSCLMVSSGQYYRNGNEALLTINSEYDGVRKDTTFLFLPGEPAFYNEVEYMSNNTKFYQYAFNRTSHETASRAGTAGEYAYIEGGGGLKPVVLASELREKALAIIGTKGDPAKTIINHATIYLPFEVQGEDYEALDMFPPIISPTCMIQTDTSITFAGLSDASASTENQGDIDRSNLTYRPDITHHFQEIILLKDLTKLSRYDIWFLTVHTETVETANEGYNSEYLQQLMYAQYYNSLYGGYGGYGYGGYGYGYGSYGYGGYGGYGGYSNYYNYLMLAQYMNNYNSSTTKTTQELDKDRYYRGILNGPGSASERKPKVKITFSVPKK